MLESNSAKFINSLFLPEGTEATVFKSKIDANQQTIAKLLFSKLIKEFNYGLFDKTRLSDEIWLSKNLESDSVLAATVKNDRLKQIRVRGLKYSNFDSANYKLDQLIRDLANTLTFSDEKIGGRNLDALYDDLYDAQYLYDNGRLDEGRNRLNQFSTVANQLFTIYGDKLKQQFKDRVKKEYEYLSFVEPSDSLYQLKLVLEKIYLDSIKGEPAELSLKFNFLTEKLNALAYFAESKQIKTLKEGFDDYMNVLKDLLKTYNTQLAKDLTPIQRQNQAMDNLFLQYPDFYRVSFMTSKLYLENQYLSLLPSSKDKLEEIQTVIAQRISFLKQLQHFFLNGDVPLVDAQNIVALLFSEIGKIELPSEYQVAVSQLFSDRLQDYGVFSRFLGSPEYVDSKVKGITMRDRFEAFKKDYQEEVSIDTLRQELGGGQPVTSSTTGTTTDSTTTNPTTTVQSAGNNTSTTDSTAVSTQPVQKPRVPRAKPVN
jgi:RNAse (barnase) inhibitor barstar